MSHIQRFFTVGLFIVLAALAITVSPAPSPVHAADFTAVASGDWFDATTWGGSVPTDSDNVTIPSGFSVNSTSDIFREAGTTTRIESGASFSISGDFRTVGTTINNGNMAFGDFLTIEGSFTNNGYINADEFTFINFPNGVLYNFGEFTTDNSFFNNNLVFNYSQLSIDGSFFNNLTFNNFGLLTVEDDFFNNDLIENLGTIIVEEDLFNNDVINNSCGGGVSVLGDYAGDAPVEAPCNISYVPNVGEVIIFYSAPAALYNAANGQPIGIALPHDADGNGYDAMQVTGLQVAADGTIWLSVWLGAPQYGWIAYDPATMQITDGVYQAIYSAGGAAG